MVRKVIEPPLVLEAPHDYERIGEEVYRRLDFEPARFFWVETVRPKYVSKLRRDLPAVVVALAPAQVIEKGLPAPGLLAHILVSRFCDHLPYYRLEKIFERRNGVFLPRQQMVQWTERSVRLLGAIAHRILEQIRAASYLQIDETPIRYQDLEQQGRCGQGYLWTALVPGKLVYWTQLMDFMMKGLEIGHYTPATPKRKRRRKAR